ncbi:MAG TPA: hypothetical protein VFW25_13465 [Silvibacterium sp.]|nr:hypothetical protein [Silvibacterium sp.]
MSFCKQNFSPLQRRFTVLFAFTLIATGVLFGVHVSFQEGHLGLNAGSSARRLGYVLSALPVIPFLAMMALIPRYFAREKDEFIRVLLVRALLWGFAVPLVIDTVWGFLWPLNPLVPMMNVDLFCITAIVALRVQGWRYR